jgi:hypothetical protein
MEEPPTNDQAASKPRLVGPERSGRVVVLVFVGAAAVVIAAGAWFLRWAGDLSHEGLVPGASTSAGAPPRPPPAIPPGPGTATPTP